jgi:triacylglycerol lipase
MDWCRANIGVGLSASEASQKRIPFSLKEPLLRRTTEDQLGYLPNNLLKVLLLNLLDSPAYSNLSTDYLTGQFNPRTPDRAGVEYFSIAAKIGKNRLSLIHPLWLPGLLMDRLVEDPMEQGQHDGLVTVQSAKWGRFLGSIDGTDHWEIRGSSAFGAEILQPHDDHLLNLHAKSNWLELNRYIGSWLSSDSTSTSTSHTTSSHPPSHLADAQPGRHKIFDHQTLSTRLLADWIAKKLPLNLSPSSQPILASSSSSSTTTTNNSSSSFTPPNKNPSSSSSSSLTARSHSHYPFTNPTRTVHPQFPLDDLDLNQNQNPKNSQTGFDIERFYLAVLRNLYDHGL